MKIAITSTGNSLDSDLDVHFGRCAYFVFYDTENQGYEFVVNDNRDTEEKAGSMAVHFITSKEAGKVISGQINDSGELCQAHDEGHECNHEKWLEDQRN